jgi:hypothetical protein
MGGGRYPEQKGLYLGVLKRLGFVKSSPDQSSPFTMIALRLALARDINLPSTRRKIYVFGLPRIVLQWHFT